MKLGSQAIPAIAEIAVARRLPAAQERAQFLIDIDHLA